MVKLIPCLEIASVMTYISGWAGSDCGAMRFRQEVKEKKRKGQRLANLGQRIHAPGTYPLHHHCNHYQNAFLNYLSIIILLMVKTNPGWANCYPIGLFCGAGPIGINWGQRSNFSIYVAMATEQFLNNANGPNNHHAKFEIFLEICNFPIGLYCGWQESTNCSTNL